MPNTTIISNELQILPYLNGVRLIRPEQQQKFLHRSAVVTLQELDAQPFTIYFTDKNHALMTANQALAKITGYDSIKPLCGYSIEKVIRNQEQITKTHTNNNIVIQSRRPFIFDESTDLNSKEVIKPISFKMPWYDDFNNIMGIFGCSIFVDMKIIDMTAQLNFITSHFLIDQKDADQSISKQCIYGIYYTKREMEIIKWVIRGRTMAEIGTQLNLSNRTIQNYFETIKLKAGVKNKSAFIDLVMPYFYQSLVD